MVMWPEYEFSIRAQMGAWGQGIEVALRFKDKQTEELQIINHTGKMIASNECAIGPEDRVPMLDWGRAQQLLDDLWRCGIRPAESKENGTALEATKYHLEDMRRLVFETRRGDVRAITNNMSFEKKEGK